MTTANLAPVCALLSVILVFVLFYVYMGIVLVVRLNEVKIVS